MVLYARNNSWSVAALMCESFFVLRDSRSEKSSSLNSSLSIVFNDRCQYLNAHCGRTHQTVCYCDWPFFSCCCFGRRRYIFRSLASCPYCYSSTYFGRSHAAFLIHNSHNMIHTELKQEIQHFVPALTLDGLFPRGLRLKIGKGTIFLILFLLTLEVVLFSITGIFGVIEPTQFFAVLFTNADRVRGLLFLAFALGFLLLMLETFYNTFYFRGITKVKREEQEGLTYEAAAVLGRRENDLTRAFLTSPYGKEILVRCNISNEKVKNFLISKRTTFTPKIITLPSHGLVSLRQLAHELFTHDKTFAEFLFKEGVSETIYNGAVLWVTRALNQKKHQAQWWTREAFSRIEGIGHDWSYGRAHAY